MTRHYFLTAMVMAACFSLFFGYMNFSSAPSANTRVAQPGPHAEVAAQIARSPDKDTQAHSDVREVMATLSRTSLSDTQVPDVLHMDDAGQLVVDAGCKAVIDYFLTLSGELPDSEIRQLLYQWARGSTNASAAQTLLSLFDQYQDYRAQIATGQFAASSDDDIRQQLRQRQQLRVTVFGAQQAQALFAEEDQLDRFNLSRRDILLSDMSAQQKSSAVAGLYQSLPSSLAHQYLQQHQLHQLAEHEQAIRDAGGGDAAVFVSRERTFGAAAAQRLEALDDARQSWRHRLDNYRQQRDRILASSLAAQDRKAQVVDLRERLFSDTEQLRVAALDRISTGAATASAPR